MILKDRLSILDEVLKSAVEVLRQYKELAGVASSALTRAEAYMQMPETHPREVIDLFKRVHDMQMQSLSTFNSILERFPIEHTIQEVQLLEIFRNLTEKQKQQLMLHLEGVILQKRQR